MLFLVIVIVSRRPRWPVHAHPGGHEASMFYRGTRLSRDDVVIAAGIGKHVMSSPTGLRTRYRRTHISDPIPGDRVKKS